MSDYAEKDALNALIDRHAPHGFAGVMRAPSDGCPVYVAAMHLRDALELDRCSLPSAEGRDPAECPTCWGDGYLDHDLGRETCTTCWGSGKTNVTPPGAEAAS